MDIMNILFKHPNLLAEPTELNHLLRRVFISSVLCFESVHLFKGWQNAVETAETAG